MVGAEVVFLVRSFFEVLDGGNLEVVDAPFVASAGGTDDEVTTDGVELGVETWRLEERAWK